jgi:hypothetical protein
MTSTYPRPFFLALAVPFLPPAVGGPKRSSMLLALLMLVPGLLGGADTPPTLPFDTLLLIAGGAVNSPDDGGGALPVRSPFVSGIDPEKLLEGGGPADDVGRGADVGPGGPVGPANPETARRGAVAFGGGGVATGAVVSSVPAFLFTQRFRSGS